MASRPVAQTQMSEHAEGEKQQQDGEGREEHDDIDKDDDIDRSLVMSPVSAASDDL